MENQKIMEYEKIINLLDNITNQPSKFRTKKWVKSKWWIAWNI